MKLIHNSEMDAFFVRCRKNMASEYKNRFVDQKITPAYEKKVQKQMKKAGFAEFQGSEESWPSLYLSATEWQKSPYHQAVHLETISSDGFSYKPSIIAGNRLFNASTVQKDKNRELNDWMMLRAMDQSCETVMLYQDEEDWMLDSPSEALTNDPAAAKAHGSVCTFGLGIGYFLFMTMRNPEVKDITVIEQSIEVIEMFQNNILPQFPDQKPLNIICGDAYDYFNQEFLSKFDYTYVDIWQSNWDGLPIMTDLLEHCLPDYESTDFWIEDSCLEVVWTLIYLYFEQLYQDTHLNLNPELERYETKISRYFSNMDIAIDHPDQIKDLMYDGRTLREILHVK